MMDVAMTVIMYVVTSVFMVGGSLLFIMVIALICCGELEEQAAAESSAALEERWNSAALPAPVEVELMRPVAPVVAAAPVVAKKLGYFPYSAEGRKASEKLVCAICLEVFEHGAECSEVPACRHLFHRDCIGVWMKTSTTCPLCRRSIEAGSERLSAAEEMV